MYRNIGLRLLSLHRSELESRVLGVTRTICDAQAAPDRLFYDFCLDEHIPEDDAAFGAASDVTPKFVSPSDPAAQWTGALRGPAFFAYANNYLVDTDNAIIVGRFYRPACTITQLPEDNARRPRSAVQEQDLMAQQATAEQANRLADFMFWQTFFQLVVGVALLIGLGATLYYLRQIARGE